MRSPQPHPAAAVGFRNFYFLRGLGTLPELLNSSLLSSVPRGAGISRTLAEEQTKLLGLVPLYTSLSHLIIKTNLLIMIIIIQQKKLEKT